RGAVPGLEDTGRGAGVAVLLGAGVPPDLLRRILGADSTTPADRTDGAREAGLRVDLQELCSPH
ncbi:hypothetical protein NS220_16255, partial [Microbacterium testaceum]